MKFYFTVPSCLFKSCRARLCRISGAIDALGRALVPVSRQIRENPPKERPGGPPPQLQPLLAGGAAPGGYAAAPQYGAPRY